MAKLICSTFEVAQAFIKRWKTTAEVKKMYIAHEMPNNVGLVSFGCKPPVMYKRFQNTVNEDRTFKPLSDEMGTTLGTATLDKHGEIIEIYSNETFRKYLKKDKSSDSEDMPVSFETQYYSFPLPDEFKRNGTIVQILKTGEFGVLCGKNSSLVDTIDEKAYLDYSDVQQMVMIPFVTGNEISFTHEHFNPLFLETVVPTNNGMATHDMKVAMVKKLALDLTEEERDDE